MKYVDHVDYKKFVSELKNYCTVEETEKGVIVKSGIKMGTIAAFKDGKGYQIDEDLLK